MKVITTRRQLESFIDKAEVAVKDAQEIVLEVDQDGLHTTAVSSANVMLFNADMSPSAFESFEVNGKLRLGIDTSRLSDMIGVTGKDSIVQLAYDEDEDDGRLQIDAGDSSFEMALIDPGSITQTDSIPSIDDVTSLFLKSEQLTEGIDASEIVHDKVDVGYTTDGPGAFYLGASGDTDNVRTDIERNDLIGVDDPADHESMFSVEFLSSMITEIDSGTEVNIRVATDMPIKFSFAFAEAHADATFFVAPRLPDN